MHRLIKALFWISDVLAWLLLAISAVVTVTYPVAGPVWARMDHQQIAVTSIVATCLLWFSVALGAYLITRRHALGILLITVPVFVAAEDWLAGLALAAVMALVFGLPFLLVLFRVRPGVPGTAP
ncbi:hypothetical protein [Lysobacter terrae]